MGNFVPAHTMSTWMWQGDIYSVPRLVFKTPLIVWKCIHSVAPTYLGDLCISATAASGHQNLRPASSWTLLVRCMWKGSEVSPSMYRPSGTVYRLHYEHQSYHRKPSHVHWRCICSLLRGTVEKFLCNSGTKYICTDLLIYLLVWHDTTVESLCTCNVSFFASFFFFSAFNSSRNICYRQYLVTPHDLEPFSSSPVYVIYNFPILFSNVHFLVFFSRPVSMTLKSPP